MKLPHPIGKHFMIKAIIFDIGGVLIRTEDHTRRAALEQRLGLQPGEAEFLLYNSDRGRQAQSGAISARDQWAWAQQRFGLDDPGLHQFRAEYWGGDRIDTSLLELIRSLHERYQTAIISNAMDDLLEDVVARLDPDGTLFDVVVGSAYERIMKPAPEIFLRTLERLGRTPAEAIFIDDMPANVAGAQAVGLAAIHFQPGIDLRRALAEHGVV